MVTILTSCPDCGQVELSTKELLLLDGTVDGRHAAAYVFVCVTCGQQVHRAAPPRLWALLVQAGAAPGATAGRPLTRVDASAGPLTARDVQVFLRGLGSMHSLADCPELG